jgi:uncharacterized membrane protein
MALSFGLATAGVLQPGGTNAAKSLQLLSLQLATPLILLGADLKHAKRSGPLALSFLAASIATLLACLVGWKLTGSWLTSALGRDGLVLAAALLAKNIGGGINYVAVCSSLQASPTAIAAGLCIDNIFALIYFPVTSILAAGQQDVDDVTEFVKSEDGKEPITVQSVSKAIWLAATLLWLGERLGGSFSLPACTLLTVIVASKLPPQPAAHCMGTYALYLFFATAGAPGMAVAESVKHSMLPLSFFLTTLYSLHGILLWICSKLPFKAFLPQRLLVASSAAIGGPATAVALAQAAGWESLVVPSLLVGNIGYAVATFCGLAYYSFLR